MKNFMGNIDHHNAAGRLKKNILFYISIDIKDDYAYPASYDNQRFILEYFR